jgi:hypothetical protein
VHPVSSMPSARTITAQPGHVMTIPQSAVRIVARA